MGYSTKTLLPYSRLFIYEKINYGKNWNQHCQAVGFLPKTISFATSTGIIPKNLLPSQNPTGNPVPRIHHNFHVWRPP